MSDKKLFYLEDDEVLAQVSCRALQKRGYAVSHFLSLADAEVCGNLAGFQFALLDLKLGDGNSLPLIDRLHQANSNMNIVVLTAYASIATAVQAVKSGAANYLAKPATIDEVVRAFEGQVSEAENVEELNDEMSLRRREWETIQAALAANNGNVSATARQLKMHRRTLQRKLQKKPVSE
ncbi:two-component system, response regulator RegA [Alteromonadaceae bacterium Bs31]|nr:two-component system, response regulator RegA [Alteromonadaceae bacterium Bs31]